MNLNIKILTELWKNFVSSLLSWETKCIAGISFSCHQLCVRITLCDYVYFDISEKTHTFFIQDECCRRIYYNLNYWCLCVSKFGFWMWYVSHTKCAYVFFHKILKWFLYSRIRISYKVAGTLNTPTITNKHQCCDKHMCVF